MVRKVSSKKQGQPGTGEVPGDVGTAVPSSQAVLMGQPASTPEFRKPLQAPMFYATGVNIAATGNDFTIVFNRTIPMENADGSMNLGVAMVVATVVVSVTPQTLKDFSLIIPGILTAHEKEFGEIITPFTKRLEADKAKKPG